MSPRGRVRVHVPAARGRDGGVVGTNAKTACDLFWTGAWAGQRTLPKSWTVGQWAQELKITDDPARVTCRHCAAALAQQALEQG